MDRSSSTSTAFVHGRLLHRFSACFWSLKVRTDELMKATTTRGADFSVQTLANFVVAEREASRLIGSDEMCMCCFKEIFLNRFYLLLLHCSKQGEIKSAPNDGCNSQVINALRRESCEALP